MISKLAIKKFLERELRTFSWLKKMPKEDLMQALEDVDSPPWFSLSRNDLWHNQLAMLLAGIYFPKFMFLTDMGSGKSRVSLELISYRKYCGEKNHWLVCIPDKVNIENWVMELSKFGRNLTFVTLDNPKTRLQDIEQDADVYLVHYPGLVRSCCKLTLNKKTGKNNYKPHGSSLRKFQRKFTGIILDESTQIGNIHSLTTRICRQIAKFCPYRYGLTGTPFGREPTPLWSQFYVIDDGETLGPTLGFFKEVFFKSKTNYWGGREYTFKKKMTKQLHNIINNRSIVYTEGECSDIPEKMSIPRYVNLPDAMEPYYKAELRRIRKAKGNFREIKASFLRMRQLSSGFLGIKNDETGAKAEIEFPVNPKLDALMRVIEEIPANAKMLIYYEYIWTGNRICKELKIRTIDHERLKGGQKDPRGSLRRFLEDLDCRFMVINNHFSMGLNLQVAPYLAFVESPGRPIIRQQAERRIRRSGQLSKRVFIIDIIARSRGSKHSVDERILKWLTDGRNLLRDVLGGRAEL